jgi:hypothetical protein
VLIQVVFEQAPPLDNKLLMRVLVRGNITPRAQAAGPLPGAIDVSMAYDVLPNVSPCAVYLVKVLILRNTCTTLLPLDSPISKQLHSASQLTFVPSASMQLAVQATSISRSDPGRLLLRLASPAGPASSSSLQMALVGDKR